MNARFLLSVGAVAVSLFALAATAAEPAAGSEAVGPAVSRATTPLRVMSFNIRYSNLNDGPDAWPHRKEMVASMIRFHRADLAGLQEALAVQIEDLESLLPEYGWIGVGREDGKNKGEFCPIFYLKDRFQVIEHGTFWLSETPEVPSKGWDAALNRIVTWGRFQDLRTGRSFLHFNTHFDHIGKAAREGSARLVVDKVREKLAVAPIVLTGDFNSKPDSVPYATLTAGEGSTRVLHDSGGISAHGHHGPEGSFWGFKPICVPEGPIDFVFVSPGIKVRLHGHLPDTFNGRHPSDHVPVLAELLLPPG